MKPVLLFLTLLTLSLSVYFTYTRFDRHGVSTTRIYDGTNEQLISTKGKIIFNDEETAILSMPDNGFLKYRNNDIRLKAEVKDGRILYELSEYGTHYKVNGDKGKRLLAQSIKEILETGYDARGRVERIYNKNGSQGVFTATENIKQDHIKAIYYEFLINTNTLSNVGLLEVVKKTATIAGDFEKARLLRSLTGQLKDSAVDAAYFHAVDAIDEDYEKAGLLKELLKKPLDSIQFHHVLRATAGIESDHEKSTVLRKALEQAPLSPDRARGILTVTKSLTTDFEKGNIIKQFSSSPGDSATSHAYLSVVSSMEADFEKARALEHLLKYPLDGSLFHEMALIAGSLGSDHEKAKLLKKMLHRNSEGDQRIIRVLAVVHDMDDEFEKANLLKNVADRKIAAEEDWLTLISEAGLVTNDFEKANVLTYVAGKMPHSENIRTAYIKAAKTISSEQDFGRAMKAGD
jgi:hypothetical protein